MEAGVPPLTAGLRVSEWIYTEMGPRLPKDVQGLLWRQSRQGGHRGVGEGPGGGPGNMGLGPGPSTGGTHGALAQELAQGSAAIAQQPSRSSTQGRGAGGGGAGGGVGGGGSGGHRGRGGRGGYQSGSRTITVAGAPNLRTAQRAALRDERMLEMLRGGGAGAVGGPSYEELMKKKSPNFDQFLEGLREQEAGRGSRMGGL